MRLTSLALSAALASVTVLGTGTAAHAEQASLKDKRADVVRTTLSEDGEEERVLDRASSHRSGVDVTSVRFDHRRTTIRVTVRFSRLKSEVGMYVDFFAPGDKEASYTLWGGGGRRTAEVVDADYEPVCEATMRTRKGRHGSMTATLKRSCLGDPSKVRMAVDAFRLMPVRDGKKVLYEDAVSGRRIRTEERTRLLAAG